MRHAIKTRICSFILISFLSGWYSSVWAQQDVLPNLQNDNRHTQLITPFFTKDDYKGSPYLVATWAPGSAVLTSKRRIPADGKFLLFNFDKVFDILFTVDNQNFVTQYPLDSISSFTLRATQTFTFEKIPWISDHFLLMPVIKSLHGYSLYKRMVSKLVYADYTDQGYYTKGKKYDEYIDYYEYFLIYPGNKQYKKLFLKENSIRKVLKAESALVDEFFKLYDNEINEQSLLGIVQYIDDKKYPE